MKESSIQEYQIYEKSEPEQIVVVKGTLRLQSPLAYDEPFSPIQQQIQENTSLIQVDITELEYLNSAGISSFARLILLARSKGSQLRLICNEKFLWQAKTISSLKKLYHKLDIKLLEQTETSD